TWRLVKRLRKSEADEGGFLPFAELVTAATVLSKEQLHALADDFPVMNHIANLHDLLNAVGPSQQSIARVMSERGLPLTQDVVSACRADPIFRRFLEQHKVKAIRLTEETHDCKQPRSREYTVGFVTTEDKWVPALGFTCQTPKSK